MIVCIYVGQNVEALQKAQAEIQKLHLERDRYEDSMKKAFMRGVCALNLEALSIFHGGEGRPQEHGEKPCLRRTGKAPSPLCRVLQGIPIMHMSFKEHPLQDGKPLLTPVIYAC